MLARENRLRSSRDFSHVLRTGRRAGRSNLVVHVADRRDGLDIIGPRVGLVVGRNIGNSVTRHRVSRRLRAEVAHRIDRVPAGKDVVIRALPLAAASDSARLGQDIDHVFGRLFDRAGRPR